MTQKLTAAHVLEYLAEHTLMQVATFGRQHPWIASVYYSFDKDLNIYFLSSPQTIHCQHIAQNPAVAVAITDSTQTMQEPKKGLQMYGEARQINDAAKIKHALSLWKGFLKVSNPKLTYENMAQKIISGRMYKIVPKKIKFFNQELFKVSDGNEPILLLP